MTDEQLVRLVVNCSRAIAKDWCTPAGELIERAMAELDRRSIGSNESPVLRRVGYRVGAAGLRWLDRKALIDLILNHEVPVLKHWSGDWGQPATRQRYVMLYKTLKLYAGRFGGKPEMAHALANWLHDADYVRQSYSVNLQPKASTT
ncbi:hypothetical protein [Sandarakinorhabdus sp.]|uniref:hypothetical protein n=1 Tax=Sandarakinorhabdus sp. TaxID=1916663 RepID=UPI00286D93A6|nr:hypothetical protein [Sandarakinorhabdus sp.]